MREQRALNRFKALVKFSVRSPLLPSMANWSANCRSWSTGGILGIGLGLLGVSLSVFSPTTDGSPDRFWLANATITRAWIAFPGRRSIGTLEFTPSYRTLLCQTA